MKTEDSKDEAHLVSVCGMLVLLWEMRGRALDEAPACLHQGECFVSGAMRQMDDFEIKMCPVGQRLLSGHS